MFNIDSSAEEVSYGMYGEYVSFTVSLPIWMNEKKEMKEN